MMKESNIYRIFRESIPRLKGYLLEIYMKCPSEYSTELISRLLRILSVIIREHDGAFKWTFIVNKSGTADYYPSLIVFRGGFFALKNVIFLFSG